jgi:carbon-monoxide dehydrogenase small subunit
MTLAAVYLLGKNPHPSLDEVREGLAGNLCRCTGYMKIFDAVRLAHADEGAA